MQPIYWILLIILSAIAAGAVSYLFARNATKSTKDEYKDVQDMALRLDAFKEALGSRFAQEVGAIRQEMATQRQEIATHLGGNRETMERSNQHLQKQLMEFTSGITQMSGALQLVKDSMKEVASFQDILRTPKLRGQWGEASLEHMLKEFFPDEFYERQKYFKSGEAVDAVLKIPDGKLLPIDSKFPLENFQRMIGAESEPDKIKFRKMFLDDAKREIDSVASKYILPYEGTTDFALLFIPAESVYYEIMNNIKDADVSEYARKKSIMLVSPNTFYLTLQVLIKWLNDVRVSRETQKIMKKLAQIMKDADTLRDNFRVLGGHITKTKGAYDETEHRLTLMVDRTENLLGSEEIAMLGEGKKKEE